MPGDHDHAGHDHSHSHGVPSGPVTSNAAFATAVGLNVLMVVAELVFGLISGSMALIADAGHNFSDVIGILFAWVANWLAAKPAGGRFTYGLRRSTILAALASGVLLLVATGGIIWESITRLAEPDHVMGGTVILVALIGVAINAISAALFLKGSKHDINIRGAFLHLIGDAGVSVGVAIAGIMILYTGWMWVDPIASLLVAGVVLWATWGLLSEALQLSLDAVPRGIEIEEVRGWLAGQPGVVEVHDVHVWPLSTTQTALTAHLVRPEPPDSDAFLEQLREEARDKFGIGHTTIQLEVESLDDSCHESPPDGTRDRPHAS